MGERCTKKRGGRRVPLGKRRRKGKEAEESRGRRSGVPCKGRSTARMEKEFMGGAEKESRVVLWTDSATGCRVMGVGVVRPRGCSNIFEMFQMR